MSHETHAAPSTRACGHAYAPTECRECLLEHGIATLKAQVRKLEHRVRAQAEETLKAERERDEALKTLKCAQADLLREGMERDEALARLAKYLPATNGRAHMEGL